MSRPNKPNIVLITTDSQRWDTLRCMGSPFALSPHLDRLAEEGVLFEQAHTSSPVCTAARCSLMTGLHTPIHGCIENGIGRRQPLPMFTDALKEAGYRNLMIGKTHFGPVPPSFDVVHAVSEKSNDADDAYARYIRPLGYSRVSDHPNEIPEERFMEAFLADTAIAEMEKSLAEHGDQPFFAYCSLVSPHEPFDPPGRFMRAMDDAQLPPINYSPGEMAAFPEQLKVMLGMTGAGPDKPAELKHFTEKDGVTNAEALAEEVDGIRKRYYGLAAYCDEQIGRLIAFLDRAGIRERTLVIFSSDHGLQMFDHGFNDKHNYYDASWRVPFIMSMPGTLPSGERRDFAIWNDIPATILGAAGTASPYIQGFDLFTPLAAGLPSPRRCAVGSLYKSAALATKRWKLEYYFEERRGRMFDRRQDPHEQRDVYDDPAHRGVRGELLTALLHWRSDISDVQHLVETTRGGGPVARRLAPRTLAMRGTDAEERLNEWAERLDSY
ncbi:sulfatase family protein [Paenibacillus arenilitoris]|uniref:Sulfatase-like hydrolase/transferase n=1 Tax=Paenibacillus arenilitoris TaxID=2772299 RepID=A0A927H5J4_9BACL|nr:sulfatase-like hydrolase/transferase [Paenibacillus arenilitoris]MBD2869015.1 sulfatase-like hydrolase/transferase [Paenibacillus arenilitoris]